MRTLVKLLIAFLLPVFIQSGLVVRGEDSRTWILDDFEDGDFVAASGLSWIVLADDLAGGDTETRLELRPGGPGTPRHSLRLAGSLGSGKNAFAGVWVPLERTGRSLDLGAFEGVRLRLKGPARLDVGFHSGSTNFMARIEVGAEWRLVDVPFATMTPLGKVPEGTRWSPAALQVFGITTPQLPGADDPTTGKFSFEVDDVAFYGDGTSRVEPVASGPSSGLTVRPFTPLTSIPTSGWIDLGADPVRDGKRPALPDAVKLEAIPRGADGLLWVRVALREPPHDRWIGLNLALDTDGDPADGTAWWGDNKSFKFDRLVTVWCFHTAAGCQGYIGLADAAQVASGTFVSGGAEGLRFAIDRKHRSFVVGVPRESLGLDGKEARLIAAVGSALLYGDDVPGQGAATLR